MSLFLGDPDQNDNKKNGFKEKDYTLKGWGLFASNSLKIENLALKVQLFQNPNKLIHGQKKIWRYFT